MPEPTRIVRLIRHEESFEVRISHFYYFDENAGRRSITQRMTPEQAEQEATAHAKRESG
jgi:hypothetical protein